MPIFFLLSGFCLSLRYGRNKNKTLFHRKKCCIPCATTQGDELIKQNKAGTFDLKEFWHGRAIRILPVYYATFVFAFILVPLGYGPDEGLRYYADRKIWGSFNALYGVQSWVMTDGFGPVSPSWTISTIFFFYILFPRQCLL